jgi:NADH dehydrogenase
MKRVVIIGGGFGGINSALGLEKEKVLEIILVDPSDHFTYIPLIHEVSVGQIEKSAVNINLKKILKRTRHIKSRVIFISFKDKRIKLQNKMILSYDYLIIASGSEPNKPIKGTEELLTLKTLEDAINIKKLLLDFIRKKKKSICVIGEGATGTELISEIASLSSNFGKKLQLHHFLYFKRYFANMPKVDVPIKRQMEKLGVIVHPGEPVRKVSGKNVITVVGKYNFDLIFVCTGVIPNVIETDIEFQGGYPIDDHCNIKGLEDVYAIGDASRFDYKGNKSPNLAQAAENQAEFIVKDIFRREKGKKRKPFNLKIIAQFISVGKNYAIGVILNILTVRGFFAWFMKRSFYFFDIFRRKKSLRLLKVYILSMIFSNLFLKLD